MLELVTESDLKQQEFLISTQAQNYYHMIQVNFFKNFKVVAQVILHAIVKENTHSILMKKHWSHEFTYNDNNINKLIGNNNNR